MTCTWMNCMRKNPFDAGKQRPWREQKDGNNGKAVKLPNLSFIWQEKKTHSFHHSLSYKPFMQASWSQNEKLRSSIGQIAIMCYAWEETSMSNYNGTDPIMYHVNDIQECIMIYTNFGATSGVGISDLGWSCIVHCCGLYVNLFMLYFFILYVDMFH